MSLNRFCSYLNPLKSGASSLNNPKAPECSLAFATSVFLFIVNVVIVLVRKAILNKLSHFFLSKMFDTSLDSLKLIVTRKSAVSKNHRN